MGANSSNIKEFEEFSKSHQELWNKPFNANDNNLTQFIEYTIAENIEPHNEVAAYLMHCDSKSLKKQMLKKFKDAHLNKQFINAYHNYVDNMLLAYYACKIANEIKLKAPGILTRKKEEARGALNQYIELVKNFLIANVGSAPSITNIDETYEKFSKALEVAANMPGDLKSYSGFIDNKTPLENIERLSDQDYDSIAARRLIPISIQEEANNIQINLQAYWVHYNTLNDRLTNFTKKLQYTKTCQEDLNTTHNRLMGNIKSLLEKSEVKGGSENATFLVTILAVLLIALFIIVLIYLIYQNLLKHITIYNFC